MEYLRGCTFVRCGLRMKKSYYIRILPYVFHSAKIWWNTSVYIISLQMELQYAGQRYNLHSFLAPYLLMVFGNTKKTNTGIHLREFHVKEVIFVNRSSFGVTWYPSVSVMQSWWRCSVELITLFSRSTAREPVVLIRCNNMFGNEPVFNSFLSPMSVNCTFLPCCFLC